MIPSLGDLGVEGIAVLVSLLKEQGRSDIPNLEVRSTTLWRIRVDERKPFRKGVGNNPQGAGGLG